MRRLVLIACLSFLAASLGGAQAPCETLKVVNPYEGFTLSDFGYSVANNGSTAAIGLPSSGSKPGQVLVYERQLWGWKQTQILEAADPDPGNSFGHSLALDGDTLAVGAYRVGELNVKGAVYMFERQGDGTWLEMQKLTSTDPKVWVFGYAVALQGDDLVVGADGAVALGDGAGRVLFYKREAGVWVWKNTYPSPDSKEGDNYGTSLALEGEYLVVGSDQANAPPTGEGHAYVYKTHPLGWILQATLAPDGPPVPSYFGRKVSMSGGTVFVGAPVLQIQTGAVFVFDLVDGFWTQTVKLSASDAHIGQLFGYGIGLDQDRAVIGAWEDATMGEYAGAAYVFERIAGTWTEVAKFFGSDLVKSDTFGHLGIDLQGDDLLIGAPAVATGGGNGSAYFFTFAPGPHLTADTDAVSLSQGGVQALAIGACAEHAGDFYALAGTASGTSPGFAFGGLAVPLNPDAYFVHTLTHLHAEGAPLSSAIGILDMNGRADASFTLPPSSSPALIGLELHHAFAVLDPATLWGEAISTAVGVLLMP